MLLLCTVDNYRQQLYSTLYYLYEKRGEIQLKMVAFHLIKKLIKLIILSACVHLGMNRKHLAFALTSNIEKKCNR